MSHEEKEKVHKPLRPRPVIPGSSLQNTTQARRNQQKSVKDGATKTETKDMETASEQSAVSTSDPGKRAPKRYPNSPIPGKTIPKTTKGTQNNNTRTSSPSDNKFAPKTNKLGKEANAKSQYAQKTKTEGMPRPTLNASPKPIWGPSRPDSPAAHTRLHEKQTQVEEDAERALKLASSPAGNLRPRATELPDSPTKFRQQNFTDAPNVSSKFKAAEKNDGRMGKESHKEITSSKVTRANKD